jgi:hypothetical protein
MPDDNYAHDAITNHDHIKETIKAGWPCDNTRRLVTTTLEDYLTSTMQFVWLKNHD